MLVVESGRQHGKGKLFAVFLKEPCLTIIVHSATATDSWKSLYSLQLTPTFNLFNGAGLGTSYTLNMKQNIDH
jgi:hypothetical protein